MECPSCGMGNPPTAKFCENCGAPFTRRCPRCGHEVGAPANFCLECGARLDATPPTGDVLFGESLSPQRYTPRHLADKILANRATLEGELKQITVLFADIVGSTELIRNHDPEEAQQLLDGILQVMMDSVHRYEGTISRLMGDGLMALFGAPIADEDHAVHACYSALAMQEATWRHAEKVRWTHGVTPTIRIGLSSGEVVVRRISDDLHMDYTAIGQTVHLASRMEQSAQPGTTALTAETLRLAEGYIEVRPLGPLPIKGFAEPPEVFELIGTGAIRTRLQASAARGLSHFVGREAELTAIRAALDRVKAGRGQVVAFVGEPGVGKSRLVREATDLHRTQGWMILESSSVSYGRASSFLPVIDLLKAYFGIETRDDASTIRDKVGSKLFMLDPALGAILPALLALLSVQDQDPSWDALDPRRRRYQILDSVRRLLLRESQEQPLLLVFEDLHWIDGESQALLDLLIEILPTVRILLLLTYRPEYRHEWGGSSYYTQFRIDPLPPERAEDLLKPLLGGAPDLDPLKRHLIEWTDGNPFFLEESVRALVETGTVVGKHGKYRLGRNLPNIKMPATVQSVLAARIDRLPPDEKRLLQSATVIGKDVPLVLLEAVADLPEPSLHRGLAHLREAEFLYRAALSPEPAYTFKHALTHEAAYASLLRERRLALHTRIVDAIERLYPDRLAEQVEWLSHHALRGEAWDKALLYGRQAGIKAMGRSANREAAIWFDAARGALEHLPRTREMLELAVDLRLDLRGSLQPLGEMGRILECLSEARTVAESLGDRARLGQVLCLMTNCLWRVGEPDRAIAAGEQTLALGRDIGDVQLQVGANHHLAPPYGDRGEFRRAVTGLKWNVETSEGDLHRTNFGLAGDPAVLSRSWLAWCLAELGEFGEGTVHGKEAIRLASALGHPYSLTFAHFQLGGLYIRRGHLVEAISLLERSLALERRWDFPALFPWIASRLGLAYALGGRVADGLPLLEQAVEHAASSGTIAEGSIRAAWLSEAYLIACRAHDATELAMRALDLARAHDERANQAWTLRLLGEISSRRDPPDVGEAESRYRETLIVAEELGMLPLQTHCHLGLGKLYRRIGRRDEARAELTTAVAMLREMEMAFWLPEAERELAEAERHIGA